MRPELLYRKGRLWFATSYDWRDGVLEIDLGALHKFMDVMPRFIVHGRYADHVPALSELVHTDDDYLYRSVSLVAETIEDVLDGIQQGTLTTDPKPGESKKYWREYIAHLGPEVDEGDLAGFTTGRY